jgi:palmitoyltransferase ZDHHC3/7/25
VIAVSVLIAFAGYCTTFVLILPWLGFTAIGVFHLGLFWTLFSLLCISYYRSIMTDPGTPDPDWIPDEEDATSATEGPTQPIALTMANRTRGKSRWCVRCKKYKPPRTHHCSVCRRCILRMDHHCPWINNCVGYHNYKFFVLFLIYTTMVCIYLLSMLVWKAATFSPSTQRVQMMREIAPGEDIQAATVRVKAQLGISMATMTAFCVLGVFALLVGMMVSCLTAQHCELVQRNATTLEMMNMFRKRYLTGEEEYEYDLGTWRNIKIIFGDTVLLWLLPIHPGGEGHEFERSKKDDGHDTGNVDLEGQSHRRHRLPLSGEASDHDSGSEIVHIEMLERTTVV